jgi:hypothetical protein
MIRRQGLKPVTSEPITITASSQARAQAIADEYNLVDRQWIYRYRKDERHIEENLWHADGLLYMGYSHEVSDITGKDIPSHEA